MNSETKRKKQDHFNFPILLNTRKSRQSKYYKLIKYLHIFPRNVSATNLNFSETCAKLGLNSSSVSIPGANE